MRIKVYIVTYKRNDVLNKNLKSLWGGAKQVGNIDVTILANHNSIKINDENIRKNLKVVINTTRMQDAWGYLSRDWNYCILDCFKNYKNPSNIDWCVCAQNDVTWVPGWDSWLENNKDYDFISQPRGDQAMAFNITAIKKVGFFDERFTTLHCQEIDYFIRAVRALGRRASINDDHEDVSWSYNWVGNVITNTVSNGIQINQQLHNSANCAASISLRNHKYGVENFHSKTILELSSLPQSGEINWYPFFWHIDDSNTYREIEKTFVEEYFSDIYKNSKNSYSSIIKKIKKKLLDSIKGGRHA